MVIRSTILREEMADMPKVVYEGEIHLIDSTAETERIVTYLFTQDVVGIDSETRPSFKKGKTNPVSLLQVATHEYCFLFRLNKIENPESLIRFLESERVKKVGISLRDDALSLHRRYEFTPGGWIDLQTYIEPFGITDRSLQKIYAILFGEKISKSQRLTNWEADELSPAQQKYAAIDAWTCLKIYEYLKELERTGDYEVVTSDGKEKEKE